jgi:hypothetical protein
MWHSCDGTKMPTKFCRKTHRKDIIFKRLGLDERIILKWMLKI